jgi:hypothetical protein
MPHLRLLDFPYDVLERISSHVPASGAGAWRLTCRAVGEAAAPFRLRELRLDKEHVESARQYIERVPASATYIRRLEVQSFDFHDRSTRLFGHKMDFFFVLQRARNVQHLVLHDPHPTIVHCSSTFIHLYHLEFHSVHFHHLASLSQTSFPALRRFTAFWNDVPATASQLMTLLQKCAPGLEALTTRWDMRELPDGIPVMPGVHTVSLFDPIGARTTSLCAIFPGVRSLTIDSAVSDTCTLTPEHAHTIKSHCLDILSSGGVAGPSKLHPCYMRATLLDIRGGEEFGTFPWHDDNAQDHAALSNLLVGVQPELLRLHHSSCNPRRFRCFTGTTDVAPNVVVMQLDLQHTYGGTKSHQDIFCWVCAARQQSLLPLN